MVKGNRILVFIVGFMCVWLLYSVFLKHAGSQPALPSGVTFSGGNNVIYFLDKRDAKLYRYNTQGRLTRIYVIRELGKDLQLQ